MFGTRVTLVALSEKADPDLILDAMRSGCSEYLIKPLQVEQLCESLVRLQGRWAATQSALAVQGRVLVFLGTRGGAGTTTLAVHLATFLAQEFGKKVLLIDHHEQLGHVGLYLGLEPSRYDFCELVRNVERLDGSLVNGFLAHHESGVDVIVSADSFDTLPDIPLDHAESTLQFLRGLYDYILLDCERGFRPTNLGLIDQADELYLIATPDVPALRDLSRCVDRLMQSNISPGKLKVAINRYSSAGAVTLQQIEKAIRQPISITISNNATELIGAMNTGAPLNPQSKSDFAAQMRKWAASLVPGASEIKEEPESKRRFAFWK
jgi:pilus assembly protein CpaE